MIAHLSSEQVSEYILGQPDPLIAQHVEGCPACRAELANFRAALGEFRGKMRAWSENEARAVLAVPAGFSEPHSWAASRQLAWALLIAAVCILGSFVFPWHPAESNPSDATLLNQVDAQVSRTVPSSMEPLMKLVVQTSPGAGKQE